MSALPITRTDAIKDSILDTIGNTPLVRLTRVVPPGIELERDDEPREVDVPPLLKHALAGDPVAAAAFEALSYTARREYAEWVAQAKRDETRERRATKAVEMLKDGRRHP